jgi:hypothetical protein
LQFGRDGLAVQAQQGAQEAAGLGRGAQEGGEVRAQHEGQDLRSAGGRGAEATGQPAEAAWQAPGGARLAGARGARAGRAGGAQGAGVPARDEVPEAFGAAPEPEPNELELRGRGAAQGRPRRLVPGGGGRAAGRELGHGRASASPGGDDAAQVVEDFGEFGSQI